MVGNNLGLLGGAEQAPRFLDALASVARPAAVVIGETLDPYGANNPDHLRYHDDNRALGRLPGQVRLRVRHLQFATPWWDYLFCTPEELKLILVPTRWQLTDTYTGEPAEIGGPYAGRPRQWTAILTFGA